ncbi:MAG: hypothetical protein JW834_01675 [Candidatus Diapherotrites archaeon]|nr:hypothetical protein [Candidatus Diapherotrites archaeon]
MVKDIKDYLPAMLEKISPKFDQFTRHLIAGAIHDGTWDSGLGEHRDAVYAKITPEEFVGVQERLAHAAYQDMDRLDFGISIVPAIKLIDPKLCEEAQHRLAMIASKASEKRALSKQEKDAIKLALN